MSLHTGQLTRELLVPQSSVTRFGGAKHLQLMYIGRFSGFSSELPGVLECNSEDSA